jgi:hypothetical protein
MLSQQSVSHYLSLTPGERLKITLEACRRHEPCLLIGEPDHVDRKFELIRRENEARNANLIAAFKRSGS